MRRENVSIAKITRPKITGIVPRKRLFSLLDAERKSPVVWISAPGGSGKTTLAANYLDVRKLPCLWYRVDEGDADIATFFYYMGLAAKKANPRKKKPLPLLTLPHLQNIHIFTKRYFEDLYSRINPPFLIVFDNYQDVAEDAGFHDLIVHGLEDMPEGVNAVIVSRNEPPPQFARLRANGRCSLLGWNQIKFTVEESKEVVRVKGHKDISSETINQLHKATDGWAAGLVLLMEAAKTSGIDYRHLGSIHSKEIFEYFASEIFEKAGREMQDFLLKTEVFPRMTARMAEKLTGVHASAHLLSTLSRNNYFTAMHPQPAPVYQYHPLFREFLFTRAKDTFTPEKFSTIQKDAAVILEEAGYIDDAAAIFSERRDWDNFVPLILRHAEFLANQGRLKTLEEWLRSLPPEILEHTPWLLYWMGVCRLPANPDESRRYFDDAFKRFQSLGDQTGMWLSWSYAVDITFYAWEDISLLDKYAEIFQDIYRKDVPFPSPAVESRVVSCRFIIMMMRQMHHPEISAWAERVFSIVKKSHNQNFRLQIRYYPAIYYFWIGDFVKMHIVINALHKDTESEAVSPLLSIFGMATEALYDFVAGSTDSCLRVVSEGLKLAHKTGVHIWDTHLCGHGTFAALSAGDITTASDLIKKIEPALSTARKIDVGYYHILSSWKLLLEGDMPSAVRYAEAGTRAFAEIGTPYPVGLCHFLEAQALFELGKTGEAEASINLVRQISQRLKSKQLEFMCLIADAQFALDIRPVTQQGRSQKGFDHKDKLAAIQNQKSEIAKRGLDALRKVMELGREQGYVNIAGWRNEVMAELCVKALEAGIEVGYAKSLVRKRNLIPDAPPYPMRGLAVASKDIHPGTFRNPQRR